MLVRFVVVVVVVTTSLFISSTNAACSGLQTRRTCTCRATYSFENELPPVKERDLYLPLVSYDDCAVSLGCEKQLDCATYCLRQVREIMGANQTYLTQTGQDRLCEMAVGEQSLSENGIVLRSHWTYSGCQTDSNLVYEGLCCRPRCNCEIGKNFI